MNKKTYKAFFKGNFVDFFFGFLGLSILTFLTIGLLSPYLIYWIFKYFITNTEFEITE
jgi:uncharacterized membrane protein YjgN (DUF898 family)